MALTLPQPFGKYLLVRRLAVGGMAEIYLAKSRGAEGFQRDVVIKRILPSYSEDEAFVSMFIDEARIAARLHHPNIVQVYDFAQAEDSYYIAMEYVDGRDLRKVLDRGLKTGKRLTPLRAMHVVADIAAGLRHAHNARSEDGLPLNVVHRDVSPHNIVLAFGGEAKILDFGIAKAAARSTKTRAGTVKGKCSYMSPEQARGKPLDGRSDMFALCAIGWEILAGRKLFEGDSDFAILNAVLTQDIPPPSSVNPDVPPELDAILLKGLERDRDARHPDMAALEKELRNFEFRHAKGLDEIAVAPYLADLFADEMPVHPDQVPAATPHAAAVADSGTLMMPEERAAETTPQARPATAPTPAPASTPTPEAPTPVAPAVSAPTSGAMPRTVPVGNLQKELEDYLAASGTGTLTPSAGTAPPVAPAPSGETTPVRGTAAGVTPARGTPAQPAPTPVYERKNITLPLPVDEIDTVLARPPPSKTTEATGGKAAVPSRSDATPQVLPKAGGGSRRTILVVAALVGLAAVGVVIAMVAGRGGDESPAGRTSAATTAVATPPAATPPAATTPAATPPAGVAVSTDPVPVPVPEPAPVVLAKPAPVAAVLALSVDPATAKVLLDGKPVATPGGQAEVKGVYKVGDEVEVSATAPGRKAFHQKVALASVNQAVQVRLEKAADKAPPAVPVDTGFVTINARPWADVYWKGRKVGTTPLRSYEVPVGNQVFVLKNPVASKELPVVVEKGRTTSHLVDVR